MLQYSDQMQLPPEKSFKEITTLAIGGPISETVTAEDQTGFINAIAKAASKRGKYLVIGSGSNLLVSDDGYDGAVIINRVSGMERDGNNLTVKSGTKLQDLVDFANGNGLAGLENLAGIPGTVGGAVYGNAGAYGQTVSDHLAQVTAYDHLNSRTVTFKKEDCGFNYRDSIFKKNKFAVLEAVFSLMQGDPENLKATSLETIKKREVKYPPGIKCPGSFFKNIPAGTLSPEILGKLPENFVLYGKVSAGALLESVGAKGASLRNIKIAEYHANLFANEGNGTARDFYDLAETYSKKVYEKYGIRLEPEVQLINLPPLT